MVRLVSSNHTEQLLVVLAERVRAQQARDGALVPVRVVIPTAMLERYVRLGMARVCGIAANLETMLLTRFAAQIVAERTRVRVAASDELEAMALTLLLDDSFLQEPELVPVRAYLRAVEGDDAVAARRVQLAAHIGRLFEEYTYSREEMLAGWRTGTTLDARHAETERWQRRVWLGMFGDDGIARARGVVPLHEAAAHLERAGEAHATPVHLFGFAHFAPVFHRLLARLGRLGEACVYSLSPCEGFWEDFDPNDPPPLHLWGRPGREHVRALDQIAGFEHDDRFVEPPRATLLAQLQRDLLQRVPAREKVDERFSFAHDGSVRVLEHASIRRELEAIASEIWELVVHDESLRFDEIGVLLPDAEAHAYLAHLSAAFGEAHALPHQIVGVPVAGDSRVVEAVEMLLALPLGRFTRQELLRLAVHPAVVASLDDVDPQRWLAWCDALGIVHGADKADHVGTYIERDLFNWDQGLRRLALGAFMAGDASGCRTPVDLGNEAYVPYEVAPSDLRDAAAFGLLLRSLVSDARFVRDALLTTKDWARLLGALVETYVAPQADGDAEALAQCLRRLQSLAGVDLGDKRVPYRVASELARARIGRLSASRGGTGVVVSGIASMRAVPLRVVFACGLGEGSFPSSDAEDSLDLRTIRRQAGDVSARERDKYAFLELLLSAGERLVLSYVSRDPLTGDTLAPSSVVLELLHAIERGYLKDLGSLRSKHPLRRWDPSYFPDLFPRPNEGARSPAVTHLPEAHAEASTLALRRALEAKGMRLTPARVEELAGESSAWGAVAESLGVVRLPPLPTTANERVVVPMYALVKFLEFPLQGWARFRVGLEDAEEEDILARENEPLETDLREETLLLREVVLGACRSGASLEQAYDSVVRDRELRGDGPSGNLRPGRARRAPEDSRVVAHRARTREHFARGDRGAPLRPGRRARPRGSRARFARARRRRGRRARRTAHRACRDRGSGSSPRDDRRGFRHAAAACEGAAGRAVGTGRQGTRRAARLRRSRDARRDGREHRQPAGEPSAFVGAGRGDAGGAGDRADPVRAPLAGRGRRLASRPR